MAEVPMEVDEIKDAVSNGKPSLAETQASLPWVEKYRPNSLQDLIAHEDIISILDKLIESNKLPHLLFYGPPGTGQLIYGNRL